MITILVDGAQGAGKSTTALAMKAYHESRGKSVALVDADGQFTDTKNGIRAAIATNPDVLIVVASGEETDCLPRHIDRVITVSYGQQ